ncbi:substrate-binding domain-containing protein [Chromohalobacter canadensis]|nr:substrate-binding domain-containing protein [Chromohalobacter canadensis]MCT8471018.1 substrate-binding domain-containing protein [Chromohalobacter canadensis]MCT8497731.1 substrate-binding domain-containing protein [Chromohalobacter canadensis]
MNTIGTRPLAGSFFGAQGGPAEDFGREAVSLLLDIIDDQDDAADTHRIQPCELVVRESTVQTLVVARDRCGAWLIVSPGRRAVSFVTLCERKWR